MNLQYFGAFSSLDIGKILSYSVDTVWTRFREHRVQNAAVASIAPVAVVTCLSTCLFDLADLSACLPLAPILQGEGDGAMLLFRSSQRRISTSARTSTFAVCAP
jgi:hypothetical protein